MLAIAVAAVACTQYRDPIVVEEGLITIENQTDSEWKDIQVVVNDYFGARAPSLAAGARMNAVLSGMQTGFGQRFDRSRMSVYKIEVFAKDASGNPVKLKWGTDRTAQ